MTNNTNTKLYEIIGEFRQEMTSRFDKIENTMNNRFEKIECDYVRQSDFAPVKAVTFGMVGFVLLAFLGGLTILVFKKDVSASLGVTRDILQVTPFIQQVGNTIGLK